ncbi:hypothetical protein EYF80_032469 [Liparis tanakae]|uniref:Uncharacterized protein n=1 Tax=Liparis tanakae TaxID=230148 RepID=A0A4Z2GVM3_9TELE|nr:hypothetical protein EYF80_032469 [Liparis tanakae]
MKGMKVKKMKEMKNIWMRLTSVGHQRVDELLGVADVERRHRHQAVRPPHADAAGEADEVEAVPGAQVPQDGEQGVFGLRRKRRRHPESTGRHPEVVTFFLRLGSASPSFAAFCSLLIRLLQSSSPLFFNNATLSRRQARKRTTHAQHEQRDNNNNNNNNNNTPAPHRSLMDICRAVIMAPSCPPSPAAGVTTEDSEGATTINNFTAGNRKRTLP